MHSGHHEDRISKLSEQVVVTGGQVITGCRVFSLYTIT